MTVHDKNLFAIDAALQCAVQSYSLPPTSPTRYHRQKLWAWEVRPSKSVLGLTTLLEIPREILYTQHQQAISKNQEDVWWTLYPNFMDDFCIVPVCELHQCTMSAFTQAEYELLASNQITISLLVVA